MCAITRRELLVMAGLGLAVVPLSACGASAKSETASDRLALYRNDAARSGISPGPGPDASNGVNLLWESEDLEDWDNAIYADNRLIGSIGDAFRSLNAQDLSENWSVPILGTAPAVAGDRVFVGGEDGRLSSLSFDDGSEHWAIDLDGVATSPAIVDGQLFFSTDAGTLYCVESDSGEQVWTSDAVWPASAVAVADGFVFAENEKGGIMARSVETGEPGWSNGTGGQSGHRYGPSVVDGKVYATTSKGSSFEFDTQTGELLRSARTSTGPTSAIPITVVQEHNVFMVSNGEGSFIGRDLENWDEVWRIYTDSRVPPAVAGGVVYAAGKNKTRAYDIQDGELLWEIDHQVISQGTARTPIVADGVVYCFGREGAVAIAAGDA